MQNALRCTQETGEVSQDEILAKLWKAALRAGLREGLPRADAEDVASLALIDFLEARTLVLYPTAWVSLVARRKAWTQRRRSLERVNLAQLHGEHLGRERSSAPDFPEVMLDLRAALASLGGDELQTVLSRDFLGEDFETIADSTGLSVKTVKRRLRRGRESLQRSLSGRSVRCSLHGPAQGHRYSS